MTSGKRGRSELAHSLFPFLAVLLCTMGALILMLMIIVSQSHADTTKAVAEKEERSAEIEAQVVAIRDLIEKDREQIQLEIEKKRNSLQSLEDQANELTGELKELSRTSELITQKLRSKGDEDQPDEEKISKLQKQLSDVSDKLKKKLDKPTGDKPVFAIIPYEGTNGTHRRPIYLECRDNGILIQPEGVLIPLNDLKPPYGPGNPLDAALRTIRSFYSPESSLNSAAYPLLVVRESGIKTYALARLAMSGWDDQFGYELVEDSLELAYPEGEPALEGRIEQALVAARSRQAALVMAMPLKYRQMVEQLSADNFEFSDREGGLGGTGLSGSPYDEEGAQWNAGGVGGGSGGADPRFAGAPRQSASGQNTGSLYGDETGTGSASGIASGNNPLLPSSGRAGFAFNGNSTSGPSANGTAGGSSSSPIMGFGSPGSPSNAPYGSGNGSVPSSGTYPGGGEPSTQTGFGYRNQGNGTFQDSLSSSGEYVSGGNGTSSGMTGNDRVTGQGGSQAGGGGSYDGGASGGQPGNFSDAMAAARSGGGTGQGDSMNRSTASANGGGSAKGTMSTDPGSMDTAATSRMRDSSASPNEMPSQVGMGMGSSMMDAPKSAQKKKKDGSEPIASNKGRDWAYSGSKNGTPVVRSIRITCYADRWIVLPDQLGRDRPVTVMLDVAPQKSADELARVITKRIDGWGLALSGGHWKPVLEIDVGPGGEKRYEQLLRLMEGSGLELKQAGMR